MGSPLAPTFANFFMDEFEKTNMEEFEKLGVRCWYRYVDDTFVLMDKDGSPDELLKIMNKKHSNMQFTVEHEKNKKIPFLDTLVHRSTLGFATSVHHKPTFTGSVDSRSQALWIIILMVSFRGMSVNKDTTS
jgi:peptide-methionine (R)-S-oxide reductase